MTRILLASASPRRRDLLEGAGFAVRVHAATIDERPRPGEDAAQLVERLAREKAAAGAREAAPDEVVVAGDTVIALDGEILGKPAGDADALRMLRSLSGRGHVVLGGWCVRRGERERSGVARTEVRFRALDENEIAAYVATGEPRDKAGAYALQGGAGAFVDRLRGSRENVVGLPLAEVRRAIAELAR